MTLTTFTTSTIFYLNNLNYLNNFWRQFLMTILMTDFWKFFSDFLKILWPYTWHLRHWLHCWQLRTTLLTITLWPLNKVWQGQHSQFLRCFNPFLKQVIILFIQLLLLFLEKSLAAVEQRQRESLFCLEPIGTGSYFHWIGN